MSHGLYSGRRGFPLLVALLLALHFSSYRSVVGQETTPPAGKPAAETPAPTAQEAAPSAQGKAFEEALAEWNLVEQSIRALIAEYQMAKREDREAILGKYEAAVAGADAPLANLRTAAVAAFEAEPNTNAAVVDALIRSLADDVRSDRNDTALALGRMMIEKGCENGFVYNFAGVAAYGCDDFDAAQMWLNKARSADKLTRDGQNCRDDVVDAKDLYAAEIATRQKEAAANDLPRVQLETAHGTLVIELFENEAPETVGNFVSLVEKGYYDGLTFHRVLGNFMAQGGCPEGTGTGGPGYKIYCECQKPEHRNHFRGTLSMAHAGRNTGGSQFFITFRRTPHLDGRHTAFGRVVEGLDVLEKLQRRDPQSPGSGPADKILKATVLRKRDHQYKPHKVE